MKVGFVSLGCSKNLVDTEMLIGMFKENNYEIVNDVEQAEIIIINTCGFIKSAKEEAINTIIEMGKYKENGTCKYLIVMGCLVERYKKELRKSMPEVDLFIKISEYNDIWKKLTFVIDRKGYKTNKKVEENLELNEIEKDIFEKRFNQFELDYNKRVITTGETTAYLKIAEGCSNFCTYCAIPYIRGQFVSRKMEDILQEAEILAKKGVKEIILVAQDTSKYGIDIYGEYKLAELLNKISKIDGFKWIRFLYTYPESITDELINEVKNNQKICKYFDMPIQHISNNVLKRMNRKGTKETIINVINKIRENIPEAIIRTTLIVGFPGETTEDFNELYKFVLNTKFDRLGVFSYSKEEGTPAAKFNKQIHYKIKRQRNETIMNIQKEIMKEKLDRMLMKEHEAVIDGITEDGKFYIARTRNDAPDVDCIVYLKKRDEKDLTGQFVKCLITKHNGYDLVGEIV